MPERIAVPLYIRMFGAFDPRQNDEPLSGLEMREGRRLLALLTLHANRLVPTSMVADAFWPDTGSLESVRKSIQHLRTVLGPHAERIETQKGFVRLNLGPSESDLLAFDRAVASGDPVALGEVVDLHRGPLLEGWDDAWVARERDARKRCYLDVLKRCAEQCRATGDHGREIRLLRDYSRYRSTEEWVWFALMTALVQAGERFEAMRLYERSREAMFRRIDPPIKMTQLYEELQRRPAGTENTTAETLPGSETAGGAVSLDSKSYIIRPEDRKLQIAVSRGDSIILIKGPRQVGKTSMLARGLQEARRSQAVVAQTDLQKLNSEEMSCPRAFFRALGHLLAEQLELDVSPDETWNSERAANANFERFLRREILGRTTARLIWGIDEADRLFSCPFSMDVFALFRSWHNGRALDPNARWDRLTLVIAYATEAHLFISDMNQSPFNVGTRLTLVDFTRDQIMTLNERMGSPLKSDVELSRLIGMVGGHPYLVHHALHELAEAKVTFDEFEARAICDDGPFGNHLSRLRLLLGREAGLSEAVQQILAGKPCPSESDFYRLRSAGVIVGESEYEVGMRTPLYQRYLMRRNT